MKNKRKHYLIYKTTNLINGKIYIGQHQTFNVNDGYLGSGKYLKHAVAKYGVENFIVEILFDFDNAEEMNSKEIELLSEDFCSRHDTYNIAPGGFGGHWQYVNIKGLNVTINQQRLRDPLFNEKATKASNAKRKWLTENDPKWRVNINKKISDSLKDHYENNESYWTGKRHTDDTKKKMSGPRTNVSGENNSQHGSFWCVCSSTGESKKFKSGDDIPKGWFRGRVLENNPPPNITNGIKSCSKCVEASEWLELWKVREVKSIRSFVKNYSYAFTHRAFSNMMDKYSPNWRNY